MNHEEMTDLLHDYARGKLSDEKRLVVEHALEKDPELRAELEQVHAYYGDLNSMPEIKAPDDFLQKVRGRIEQPDLLGQLRNLLFYPLHIKLPIEVATAVGVSLLVIVIYNPFAPKVPMPEQFAAREIPEVSSGVPASEAVENDKGVRQVDNLTSGETVAKKSAKTVRQSAPAKKIMAPARRSGYGAGPVSSQTPALASAAPSGGSAEKTDRGESGIAPSHGIAGMSKSKAAASPSPSASKPSVFADEQEFADGYVGGGSEGKSMASSAAPVAMSSPGASGALLAEAPASAPSSPSAGLSDKKLEDFSAPSKASASLQETQVVYNWVPAPDYKSSREFERSEMAEQSAEKEIRFKRSEASPAREESQVSGQVMSSNRMKSDNIGYLKSLVANAGGTCTAGTYDGSHYRIKIPAKNFQRFEKEMRSRGDFLSVSGREMNLTRTGLKDSLEIIVNIIER